MKKITVMTWIEKDEDKYRLFFWFGKNKLSKTFNSCDEAIKEQETYMKDLGENNLVA